MKVIKTKGFDAVAESRRWKEVVARQTEGLELVDVLAFFEKGALLAMLQDMRAPGPQAATVREEPPSA